MNFEQEITEEAEAKGNSSNAGESGTALTLWPKKLEVLLGVKNR